MAAAARRTHRPSTGTIIEPAQQPTTTPPPGFTSTMVRRPSPPSSNPSTPSLDVVPEHVPTTTTTTAATWKLPPSLQMHHPSSSSSHPRTTNQTNAASSGSGQTIDPRGKGKGKARQLDSSLRQRSTPSQSTPSGRNSRPSDWIVDPLAVHRAKEEWKSRERVILVLGSPSADSLSPLLYDSTLADTLLLVGTPNAIPSLEALVSAPDTPERIIQPTLRLFVAPEGSVAEGRSPIPVLLEEAQSIAKAYHVPPSAGSGRWSPKRLSSASMAMMDPRSRSSVALNEQDSSDKAMLVQRPRTFFDNPFSSLPRTGSDLSLNNGSNGSNTPRSRLSTFSLGRFMGDDAEVPRRSSAPNIYDRRGSASSTAAANITSSPFDAILNFVSPSATSGPNKSIQEMLHQVMVLTTGVWPIVMGRTHSPLADQSPIPMVHVLSSKVVNPVPNIIENFVLNFTSSMVTRGKREMRITVVASPVWKASQPDLFGGPMGDSYNGVEILLFNGIRHLQAGTSQGRMLVRDWRTCVEMPGALSTPASDDSQTAGTLENKPLPGPSAPSGGGSEKSSPGYTTKQLDGGLSPTPELDQPSVSSCSSNWGSGTEPLEPASLESRVTEHTPVIVSDTEQASSHFSLGSLSGSFGTVGRKMGTLSKGFKRMVNVRGKDHS